MDEKLSITKLAKIARKLLVIERGFTIDEFGRPPMPEVEHCPWAVSIAGRERQFSQYTGGIKKCRIPSLWEIEQYILSFPPGHAYFGGWCDEEACYLDHTLLFDLKHSAVHEGIRQQQKAIHNVTTGELVMLPSEDKPNEV